MQNTGMPAVRPLTARPNSSRTVATRQMSALSVCCPLINCRLPLVGKVIHTRCGCMICWDCGQRHFAAKSSCPGCRRSLADGDIQELHVSGPPQTKKTHKDVLEGLMVRNLPNSNQIALDGLCRHVISTQDQAKTETQFVFQLLLKEVKLHKGRGIRAHQKVKELQEIVSRRDQEILVYREELATTKRKLEEKEEMVIQFRKDIQARTMTSRGRDGYDSSGHSASQRSSQGLRMPTRQSTMHPPSQRAASRAGEGLRMSSNQPTMHHHRQHAPSSSRGHHPDGYEFVADQRSEPSSPMSAGSIRQDLGSSSGFRFNKRRRTESSFSPSLAPRGDYSLPSRSSSGRGGYL